LKRLIEERKRSKIEGKKKIKDWKEKIFSFWHKKNVNTRISLKASKYRQKELLTLMPIKIANQLT